ncbi:MAG TPA: glycosyltransferase family 4 protein [Candidatus Binataceae bacterium]|nr:glycosyltransferase family 4 protein [Candidatus Binataceae bacterium]
MNTTTICCFYEAYPPASGAASVSYNLAKFWPGDAVLIQLGNSNQRLVTNDNVRVVTLAGATESRCGRIKRLPHLIRRMVEEIARAQSPVVVLEGASWAIYHWLLLQRLRRSMPQVKIIYHSHNVEFLLRLQRHCSAISMITRWAEGYLVKSADLATAVSEIDQDHFARLYGVRPVLLPNGVDTERFSRSNLENIARLKAAHQLNDQTLLFAGFYAYRPNREAIDFLVGSLMPKLRVRHPSATLALTGGGAPYHEPWLKNVGTIPYNDFASFVAACGIAVAPIFSGSGTRLKILEAQAAGLPVVATEKAAEGLSLTHGTDILFARNTDEFVNCLGELFDKPVCAAAMRERSALSVRRFSWHAIISDFERFLYPNRSALLVQNSDSSAAC